MTEKERRRTVNMLLPRAVCLRPGVLCGKRRRNQTCIGAACAYRVNTDGLRLQTKTDIMMRIGLADYL